MVFPSACTGSSLAVAARSCSTCVSNELVSADCRGTQVRWSGPKLAPISSYVYKQGSRSLSVRALPSRFSSFQHIALHGVERWGRAEIFEDRELVSRENTRRSQLVCRWFTVSQTTMVMRLDLTCHL